MRVVTHRQRPMAEELVTITTKKSEEEVFKQIEDSLSQIGQVSVTKKGSINITPKSKYNGFAATTSMEGSVRRKRDTDQYDVTVTYKVMPSVAAWVITVLLVAIGGFLILLIPFVSVPAKVKADI